MLWESCHNVFLIGDRIRLETPKIFRLFDFYMADTGASRSAVYKISLNITDIAGNHSFFLSDFEGRTCMDPTYHDFTFQDLPITNPSKPLPITLEHTVTA